SGAGRGGPVEEAAPPRRGGGRARGRAQGGRQGGGGAGAGQGWSLRQGCCGTGGRAGGHGCGDGREEAGGGAPGAEGGGLEHPAFGEGDGARGFLHGGDLLRHRPHTRGAVAGRGSLQGHRGRGHAAQRGACRGPVCRRGLRHAGRRGRGPGAERHPVPGEENLAITRPKNYSGPPSSRAKLQSLTLKDLIASHAAAGAGPSQASSSAWVQLSGIPSSMGSKSVFDLLQQFGGPLKSLDMPESCPGSGVAEYVDRKSALEALKFSPLLGFIEVKAIDAAAAAVLVGRAAAPAVAGSTEGPAAKRLRRTRFDPTPAGAQEADENDLGPFEAALRGRGLPPAAAAPAEDALDLGPFEAVLPKRRSDPDPADDLGPFESVLPPARGPEPEDDLGPFESVLPPRPGAGPAAADGSATEEESRQRPRRTTTWAPSGPRSRASRGKPVVAAGPEASVVRRRAPPLAALSGPHSAAVRSALSVLVPIPLLPAAPPAASARAPRGGSWRRRRLQTAARDG
ncbi:unnamed protein product, partial [Prorocentrum cordatum]